MKVKELIEKLKKCDGEKLVVMTTDPEGNGYNPLRDIEDNSNYDPKEREVGIAELTEELKREGWTEEDCIKGVPCITLWAGYYKIEE